MGRPFRLARRLRVGAAMHPPLLAYVLLAYAISWTVWAPLWLPHLGVTGLPVVPYHHAWGALGPLLAAFAMTFVEEGRTGVALLARSVVDARGRAGWLVMALVAPYGLRVVGAWVAFRVEGQPLAASLSFRSDEFPQLSALGFLLYNVLSFGLGEEVGWRGYALPRLQARYSAVVATVVLTVVWAGWHLPLFLYRPGYTGMGAGGVAGWFFSLLTGAVLLTWMFNGSRGSVLVVAVFHATMDVAFTAGGSSPLMVNVVGAAVTVWGVAVLLRRGPRGLSHRARVQHPMRPPAR